MNLAKPPASIIASDKTILALALIHDAGRRESLVSEQQDLFHVWTQDPENVLKCEGKDIPSVADPARPRYQRGPEFAKSGRDERYGESWGFGGELLTSSLCIMGVLGDSARRPSVRGKSSRLLRGRPPLAGSAMNQEGGDIFGQ